MAETGVDWIVGRVASCLSGLPRPGAHGPFRAGSDGACRGVPRLHPRFRADSGTLAFPV